jgi:hypothetical protein
VAGGRSFGDALDRREIGTGVVLGNPDQQSGQHQTDRRCAEDIHRTDQLAVGKGDAITKQHGRDRIKGNQGQDAGHGQTTVEGVHDLAAIGGLDEETTDDRGDDRYATEYQRVDDQIVGGTGDSLEHHRTEHHRRHHGHCVGLEEVGSHPGAVADVVADVVGDDGGVAWIIFRNTGFDLADQVGANVCTLGEDATAKTGEDRDQ